MRARIWFVVLCAGLGLIGMLGLSASGTTPVRATSDCFIFPSDSILHYNVVGQPLHSQNTLWRSQLGNGHLDTGFNTGLVSGTGKGYHPYTVDSTGGAVPFVKVTVTDPNLTSWTEAPIPTWALVQDQDWQGTPLAGSNDKHLNILDLYDCTLYESWKTVHPPGGGWQAETNNHWNTNSNAMPHYPSHWPAADAAGLPMFALMIKYSELYNRNLVQINHAMRFIIAAPRIATTYVWPAVGSDGSGDPSNHPPMGARMRLRANTWPTTCTKQECPGAWAVATALQRYGAIISDSDQGNGPDIGISGEMNVNWTWDDIGGIESLQVSSFDFVEQDSLQMTAGSYQAKTPTP